EPLHAVAGNGDGESKFFESALGNVTNGVFVVDDERLAGTTPLARGQFGRGGCGDGVACDREEQLEGRSAPGLARDVDGAAVTADDAEHGGQPEAATGEFRRE